jgi:hypothetical protein
MIKSTLFLLAGLLFITSEILPQKPMDNNTYYPTSTSSHSYLNLNNISTIFQNNGISDYDPTNALAGFKFPKVTGRTAIFTSGLLWGVKIPGDPQPRVGGSVYNMGLQGGKIISPGVAEDTEAPHIRIYRVRPDVYPGGPIVDLSWETFDEGKTEAEIRAQYELDWVEWRAIDGAPFDDIDVNGIYDPNTDVPGVPGASQTIWFVANDLDPIKTGALYGSLPIGIEYQATYWEYNNGCFLDNLFFRKYRLINKSSTPLNDMYISMWSDPAIGNERDDLAGCDTILNLGYAFNANDYDTEYAPYPPPAIGFDLLKGPITSDSDTLPMTAYYFFWGGDPNWGDPPQGDVDGAWEFYNFMQGRYGMSGETFTNPITGQPTTFALSGDPLTEEGWIDSVQFRAGDRRFGFASGPFNMAVGDTQEIVIAEIVAIGVDRLHSLKKLIYYDVRTQTIFDNGLNNSTPPVTPSPVAVVDETNWKIELDWGIYAIPVEEVENFNQASYSFQGYNVYQLPNDLQIKENAVRLATFDIIDGVTEIGGIVMDQETGLPINGIQQYGSDSGIKRTFSTNYDHIENANMIVGKTYYFAVTAYSYNPDPEVEPNNSESIIKIIKVVFNKNLPGNSFGDSVKVMHSQGSGDGEIHVTVADPIKLTGDDYEVYFDKQKYFRNEDGEWVPIPPGIITEEMNGTDTLTGSTVDIGAIYGPTSGVIELGCYFNYISPDYNRADGISMIFPPGITIIDAPHFYANGGVVTPEIIGNTVNLGIVDGSQTGYGIFGGSEEWTIYISTFQPPLSVDWIIYDDGYSSSSVNAEGSTVIDSIGYAFKTEQHWNVRNLTRQVNVLEDQTVINGYDLYTRKYVGNPIVDGFEIGANVGYEPPIGFSSLELDSPSGLTTLSSRSQNDNLDIQNYTIFGGTKTSKAIDNFDVGTNDVNQLEQDYELRFTCVLDTIILPDGRTFIYTESGGSMATIFRIQGDDFTVHPSNNTGVNAPFQLRIPFEVWNVEDPENEYQVNLTFMDRLQDQGPGGDDPLYSWNLVDRMYSIIVNSPYDPIEVVQIDDGPDPLNDPATWVLVHYGTNFHLDDVVKVIYRGPITSDDRFNFTSPEPADTTIKDFDLNSYHLFHNYPNPFNLTTRISFYLPLQGVVKLEVNDILGQRVVKLINSEMEAGKYDIDFNANNLASGVYIYLLNVKDKFFEAKKMILLK